MVADRDDRETEVIHKAKAEFRRHGGLLNGCCAKVPGFTAELYTPCAMRARSKSRSWTISTGRCSAPRQPRHCHRSGQGSSRGRLPDLRTGVSRDHYANTAEVCIAVPRNSEPPHLDYPPIRVVRLSQAPYEAGIETHKLDGVAVKVISAKRRWLTASSTATRFAWTPACKQSECTRHRVESTPVATCLRRCLPCGPCRAALSGIAAMSKNLSASVRHRTHRPAVRHR